MLAEFIGAVIVKDGRYLIEPVEKNKKTYVRFPRVETVNAIAQKEDILKHGLKMKYGIEVKINRCIYQEDFTDRSDVISYAYFIGSLLSSDLPADLLWIGKEDFMKVDFVIGDDIIIDKITNTDMREVCNVQDIFSNKER
ncbi:MAG: hypothetical protein WC332_10600 [Clostridia bacterium]|jgi:hypothetical protein